MPTSKILLALLVLAAAALRDLPPAPTPYCTSLPVLPLLPLAVPEVITADLSQFFAGYNLDIILQSNNFSFFIPKSYMQSANHTKLEQPISMQLRHNGNTWGTDYVMIANTSRHETLLHYGQMHNNRNVPRIDNTVMVENRNDTDCFDAVGLNDLGLLVVDCATRSGPVVKNVFVIVDMSSGEVLGNRSTAMFEQFRWVSRRKLMSYRDLTTGYSYLLRTHFGDGVDPQHQDNTYIQLFLIDSSMEFDLVTLLDRTMLGDLKLRIMDVQLYKRQLFFLDWNTGIYRVDITSGQTIKPRAFYVGQYYSRFGVYSDNMDDQLVVALANQHAVYEINWDVKSDPKMIMKYSLVQNSTIRQVMLNRQFVVVQSSGEAAVVDEFSALLNYTWVFSRGSRTYTNAFKVFGHPSENVLMDMDPSANYIMLVNSKGIENHAIGKPILTINITDREMLNKQFRLGVIATSSDYINPNVAYCVESLQLVIVQPTNMSLWPTGKTPYEIMYINYPGQLEISLDAYALGPNITYTYLGLSLHEGADWVWKQNRTNLTFHPTYGSINYLHTDVVEQYGNNTILMYCQDQQNNTYVSLCINEWETDKINCSVLSHYQHKSKLNSLATAFVQGTFQLNYIYILNLEGSRNTISMFWFSTSQRYGGITYPEGIEGEVGELAVSNGILFVTLPKIKQIDAYYLDQCDGVVCPLGFSITVEVVRKLGVQYFAPRRIRTTRTHPQVIFIECLDSVLVLDVDNPNNILLLTELLTTATRTSKFQIAINQEFLVIVAPQLIEEYRMVDLYKGRVVYHKQLPLYHYTVDQPFDLEFNNEGNLFYLTAVDTNYNRPVILVYRLGSTLVNSLYDVIKVSEGSRTPIQLEVSGGYVDFVTVVQDGAFTITKQYQHPQMVMKNEDHDIQFLIEAKNTVDTQQINKVTVKVANYPDNFNRSRYFPSSTATYFTQRIEERYTWSDRDWFRGHILGYYSKCEECPNKLSFESHLLEVSQLELQAEDYHRSSSGGYVLWDDVFRLFPDGTVRSIETLPKPNLIRQEVCKRVFSDPSNLYVVAACVNSYQEVNLYLTSYVSRKGFTLGPWKTASSYVANLEITNGLMILVDVAPQESSRIRGGGVFIYSMSLDSISDQRFVELDYIDTNDLAAAHGWPSNKDVFVANAHLIYSNQTKRYRLFVTEVKGGLFIASFDWLKGYPEISMRSVDYLDLSEILNANGLYLPTDASYSAVTHLRVVQSQHFQIDSVVVVCSNYHTFEFNLLYQSDGRLQNAFLNKVYYRYGFYRTYNFVKAWNGFLAVPFTITPVAQYMTNFSRQVVGLYDTLDYQDDDVSNGYRQRFIISGHILDTTTITSFDFNATRGGNELGLVVIDPKNKIISENKISKNLSIVVHDKLYKTQNLYLWPYSDFYKLMFEMRIIGQPDHSLKWWEIMLIVIGALLAAVGLFFGSHWIYKKWKLSRKKTYLLEEDAGEYQTEGEEDTGDGYPGAINQSVRDSTQTATLEEPLLPPIQEYGIADTRQDTRAITDYIVADEPAAPLAANVVEQQLPTEANSADPASDKNVVNQQQDAPPHEDADAPPPAQQE